MIVTEAEARAKWCPFTRTVTDGDAVAYNRGNGIPSAHALCIGSDCMAWQWVGGSNGGGGRGYCGLAGQRL